MTGARTRAACLLLLALLTACEKGRSPEPKTAVPAVRSDVQEQTPGKLEGDAQPGPGLQRTAAPARHVQLPEL